MASGGTESTLEPVDTGCTTNNSTSVPDTQSTCVLPSRRAADEPEADGDDRCRRQRRSARGSPAPRRRTTAIPPTPIDRRRRRSKCAAPSSPARSRACRNVCGRPRTPRQPGRNLFAFRARAAPRPRADGRGRAAALAPAAPLTPAAAVAEARRHRRGRRAPTARSAPRSSPAKGSSTWSRKATTVTPRYRVGEDLRRCRRARRRRRQQRPTARAEIARSRSRFSGSERSEF